MARGRLPHAVLLAGAPGTGKRAAAAWMARHRLGVAPSGELPQYPYARPEHADLYWIAPQEDKQAIGIDQIRVLVDAVGLTSYAGGAKVAIIEPANLLTMNAANSLLKTLEEPPGDALIILVADRTARLPATIFSRCERISFAAPNEAEGLSWLQRLQPGTAWTAALRAAGNAPIAALAAVEQLETGAAMGRDFGAVASGRASALDVAARWTKIDAGFVLDWLARQIQLAIRVLAGAGVGAADLAVDESVLKRMDRRNLFCYLDTINRMRGQPAGSFNVQLTLEGLLIDWAQGLQNIDREQLPNGMKLMLANR